eukprot:jgi/Bigna1/141925/aug1.66_g16633
MWWGLLALVLLATWPRETRKQSRDFAAAEAKGYDDDEALRAIILRPRRRILHRRSSLFPRKYHTTYLLRGGDSGEEGHYEENNEELLVGEAPGVQEEDRGSDQEMNYTNSPEEGAAARGNGLGEGGGEGGGGGGEEEGDENDEMENNIESREVQEEGEAHNGDVKVAGEEDDEFRYTGTIIPLNQPPLEISTSKKRMNIEETRRILHDEQIRLKLMPGSDSRSSSSDSSSNENGNKNGIVAKSLHRMFREKVIKTCHELLRKQEEEGLNTERPLHTMMASMLIVPPFETEETRQRRNQLGHHPNEADDLYREKRYDRTVGEFRRIRYFSDEAHVGFGAMFPPSSGDPRPKHNCTWINTTARPDVTFRHDFEQSMRDGPFARAIKYDNFSANDAVHDKWRKIKLDWAANGGKGFYPVNPETMDPSYYQRLDKIRNATIHRMASEDAGQ